MLTTTDVMAAKIAVQLGVIGADDARAELRALPLQGEGPDFVNRITTRFALGASVVQTIRHRVALYEHVRGEAVYLRLIEKDREVPRESVARMLAQLEAPGSTRKRLGEVMVRGGKLRAEEDKVLVKRSRASIERDDGKILERYVAEDFAGVAKPLIRGSNLDPGDFKISTLFRSKETRALVDAVDLERLRAEARQVHDERAATGAAPGLTSPTPVASAAKGEADTVFDKPPPMPTPVMREPPVINKPAHLQSKARAGPAPLKMEQVGSLKRIADYEIVETLGVGGMGAVFLGQRDGGGEYVAIKVMLNFAAGPAEIGRFRREIALGRRVKHPGAIAVLDAGETPEGLTYLVVPALAGKELRSLIDAAGGHGLPPQQVVKLFTKVLEGMQAIHEQQIVHRDLKPENIFVRAGADEDTVIMDFGLAKLATEVVANEPELYRSTKTEVVGSPMYIAPESITCDPVDARTDIYSLGVILFEMFTGKLPLESETTSGYLGQHLISPPLTLAEVAPERRWPPGIEALVAHMLGKTREERPNSCKDVLDVFRREAPALLRGDAPPTQLVPIPVIDEAPAAAPAAEKPPFGFKGLLGRLWGR